MIKKIVKKITKYFKTPGIKNDFCSIGEHSNIGNGYLLVGFSKARISIGKYCDIAENFRVRPRNHSIEHANMQRQMHRQNGFIDLSEYKGNVVIGHACWFGDNVTVLSGVKIGNGVVIGAGSIVTKDIPDFSVAAGAPAKVIKYRFSPEIIALMNHVGWWHWDKDKILLNRDFFESNLTLISVTELKRVIK